MATINNPRAGVSPFQGVAPALPTTLRTAGSLRASEALSSTVSATPATASGTTTIVNGQEALNQLISTSRNGVFQGANVTINLEEQQFSTTNQVTSTTNYPSGGDGEIQFNSGANSFASDVSFTYTESNVFTPGIRTDGYFYSNGAPFLAGGNAAIGNFVFNGDTMSTSDLGNTMFITAPSAIGGVVGSNLIISAGYTTGVSDLPAGDLILQVETPTETQQVAMFLSMQVLQIVVILLSMATSFSPQLTPTVGSLIMLAILRFQLACTLTTKGQTPG